MTEHSPDETLIEHFEKCVPGGHEALAKARVELYAKRMATRRWLPFRRRTP